MPPRLTSLLLPCAALLLAACAGTPEQEAKEAGLRDALLNMQASLAAAAGTPAAPPAETVAAEGFAALPGPAVARHAPASLVASGLPPRAGLAAATTPRGLAAEDAAQRQGIAAEAASHPQRMAAGEPAALRQTAAAGPPLLTDQLLGRTPERVRQWLGEPALRRPEGSAAEVWLYASEACALDLVLYRDRAGRLRVGFAAARARGEPGQGTTEADCLRAIAAGPPPRPAT